MSNKTLLIGIDPDVDKSGFCAYRPDLGQITQLTTFDLCDTLFFQKALTVVVTVAMIVCAGSVIAVMWVNN